MRSAHSILLDVCEAKDVHAALRIVLAGLCEQTGWSLGQAWLPGERNSGLVCSAGWHAAGGGFGSFHDASARLVIRDDDELPGAVWSGERALWVDDVPGLTRLRAEAVHEAGLCVAMGLPIAVRGRVVGVLELFDVRRHKRDEKLLRDAASMAADIGPLVARKLEERALHEREERLERLLHASHDAVWEWDLATRRIAWGPGIRSTFGYSLHDVDSDPAWRDEHIHPADRDRVARDLKAAIDSDATTWSATYRFLKADGTAVTVLDRAIITRDDRQHPLAVMGGITALDGLLSAEAGRLHRESEEDRAVGVVHRPRFAWSNGRETTSAVSRLDTVGPS